MTTVYADRYIDVYDDLYGVSHRDTAVTSRAADRTIVDARSSRTVGTRSAVRTITT